MKTIIMKYKKSTKGTHVYENAESDVLTSLYIKRGDAVEVNNQPAPEITVTITHS